jgi:hypothetical protein
VLLGLLLGLLLATAFGFYRSIVGIHQLHDAQDETEQADSRWRLADLEARRVKPGEEANSAVWVLAAHKLLPAGAAGGPPLGQSFERLPPQDRLSGPRVKALRDALARASAALTEARRLKDLPAGRFPSAWANDWKATRSHSPEARAVANLLAWDVLLLVAERDTDGALDSCRALLNCGRAVGEEPLTASQLACIACRSAVVERLERVLAQGEPSPDAMRACWELLERELNHRPLLTALRGERAGCDWMLERVRIGAVPLVVALSGEENLLEWIDLRFTGGIQRQRAALLRYFNRAIAAAGRLPHEQAESLRQLEEAVRKLPPVARRLVPAVGELAAADRHSLAQLRCAQAAVAAELYRRRNGEWPASMDVLAARRYLTEVPNDPYDGKPLRWRRLKDGVEIYSVGADRKDSASPSDPEGPSAGGSAIRFRLWDSEQRRPPRQPQPPTFGRDGGVRVAAP